MASEWLKDWPFHSCSLLKILSSERKEPPQIPEESGAGEEKQSEQGLAKFSGVGWRSRRKRVLCVRASCETLGNTFPIGKCPFALCDAFFTQLLSTTASVVMPISPFSPFQGNQHQSVNVSLQVRNVSFHLGSRAHPREEQS